MADHASVSSNVISHCRFGIEVMDFVTRRSMHHVEILQSQYVACWLSGVDSRSRDVSVLESSQTE